MVSWRPGSFPESGTAAGGPFRIRGVPDEACDKTENRRIRLLVPISGSVRGRRFGKYSDIGRNLGMEQKVSDMVYLRKIS